MSKGPLINSITQDIVDQCEISHNKGDPNEILINMYIVVVRSSIKHTFKQICIQFILKKDPSVNHFITCHDVSLCFVR